MTERRKTSNQGRVVAGKYQLMELIGEGGMATVWKGKSHGAAGFARTVAIKKMKTDFRQMQNYIDMFVEEARVGAEMQHSNIVQVFDFLRDEEGSYYLVMEWVDGVDLLGFLRGFRRSGQVVPWGLIAVIGIGALRALAAAHERVDAHGKPAAVIHRDVSPHNLLLSTRGEVKLTDFGLALAKDRGMAMTDPGMVKGKLSYLAPEIVRGQPVSPSTDLFAVGSILWEALAGRTLFDGEDDMEVFRKLRAAIVPPLDQERAGLPASLVALVHKALSEKPEDRFASAREFAHALSILLGGAQSSGDAQLLLGRAVREAKEWLAKKGFEPAPEATPGQPSWQSVEMKFSSMSELPRVEEDEHSVDIWFSRSDIKVP